MPDLTRLNPQLDAKARTCRAIVECPRDTRLMYDYDLEARAFLMKRLLPDGMSFPLDFGFVPGTLAEDGDPLDILILNDEPAVVGALVDVRLIGVIEGAQTEKGETLRNDRILAVASVSHLFKDVLRARDLDASVVENLCRFWVNYDALRGVKFEVLNVKGPTTAVALVKAARRHLRQIAKSG